jgi:hypothetical protein
MTQILGISTDKTNRIICVNLFNLYHLCAKNCVYLSEVTKSFSEVTKFLS